MPGSAVRRARLGAHMSVAGGLHRAIERAEQVGATALQVFVKSARQWAARPLAASEIRLWRENAERSGLARHTLAHASYLLNLASPRPAIRERSIRALVGELRRCQQLGVPFLVLHPGSHMGCGEEPGLDRVARGLRRVLDAVAPRVTDPCALLLETTAGQGTNLGHRFEHLRYLLERVAGGERLGVCVDTCHVLAAGYDLRRPAAYRRTIGELDRSVGLDHVRAFHLNDSLGALGSRRDRHTHIGEGQVGEGGFRALLADRRFLGLPMVLETPKESGLDADRRNLALLRGMLPVGRQRRRA